MESGASLAIRPDIGNNATDNPQSEPELTLSRRKGEAIQSHFARRAQRDACVVLQSDPEAAIGPGPQAVGFVHRLPGLRRHELTGPDDERGSRSDPDATGGVRRLAEGRRHAKYKREDHGPTAKSHPEAPLVHLPR
jgi:hypothetical protein